MVYRSLLIRALALVVISPVAARKLLPRDDAGKDRSFLTFRTQLLKAVRKRDKDSVLKVLDPKVQVTFGEDVGPRDFVRYWKLDSGHSLVWKTLEWVLTHGGSFYAGEGGRRGFSAPYTSSDFPDELDAFEYYCVTAPNVPLRAKPDEHSSVVGRLNYDIVRQADPPRKPEELSSKWVRVVTAAGKRGYVARQYLRSPIDYRATFEKRNGTWRMTALVAGD